jgi:PTH1 family peptidyl-tRNA hydrolase
METFGTDEFVRIRVGIGRPITEIPMSDFVLNQFDKNELLCLNRIVQFACDAIKAILLNGVMKSMNLFNKKQILLD